jgi:hypothetical protein
MESGKILDFKARLVILCVDGLDYDYAKKLELSLPYESKLKIPKELYHKGQPYTMHIWPSIFKGKIVIHPEV